MIQNTLRVSRGIFCADGSDEPGGKERNRFFQLPNRKIQKVGPKRVCICEQGATAVFGLAAVPLTVLSSLSETRPRAENSAGAFRAHRRGSARPQRDGWLTPAERENTGIARLCAQNGVFSLVHRCLQSHIYSFTLPVRSRPLQPIKSRK